MSNLTADDIGGIAQVMEELDALAARQDANITGRLYINGISFRIDYDPDRTRHFIVLNPTE